MIVKCFRCKNYTNNVVKICSNHYHCRSCSIINKLKCKICNPTLKYKSIVNSKKNNSPYNIQEKQIQYFDNDEEKWKKYIPIFSKKIIELINQSYSNKSYCGNITLNKNLKVYWGENTNREIYTFSNPLIYKHENNQIKLWKKYYYIDKIGLIIHKNTKNNTIYLLRIS